MNTLSIVFTVPKVTLESTIILPFDVDKIRHKLWAARNFL